MRCVHSSMAFLKNNLLSWPPSIFLLHSCTPSFSCTLIKLLNLQPNQQRTLNKHPAELWCRNFVNKHRLSIQVSAKHAKTCMQLVHIPTNLPFCIPLFVVGRVFLSNNDNVFCTFWEGNIVSHIQYKIFWHDVVQESLLLCSVILFYLSTRNTMFHSVFPSLQLSRPEPLILITLQGWGGKAKTSYYSGCLKGPHYWFHFCNWLRHDLAEAVEMFVKQ